MKHLVGLVLLVFLASCKEKGSESFIRYSSESDFKAVGTTIPEGGDANILFVLDDSNSMNRAMESLRLGVTRFINRMNEADKKLYNIRMAATRINNSGQSSLVFSNNPNDNDSFLTHDIQKFFRRLLGFSPNTGSFEPGILTTVQFVENNKSMFHEQGPLHVIMVSNEDDQSSADGGSYDIDGYFGTQNLIPVDDLGERLVQVRGEETTRFHAIVAQRNRSDNGCLGAPATRGSRYINLAHSTGGKVVDLCALSSGGAINFDPVMDMLNAELKATAYPLVFGYVVVQGRVLEGPRTISKNGEKISGWQNLGYHQNYDIVVGPSDRPHRAVYATGTIIKIPSKYHFTNADHIKVDGVVLDN